MKPPKPDLRKFYICTECTHRCMQAVEPGKRLNPRCDEKRGKPNWRHVPKEQAFHKMAPDLFGKPKGIEDW